MAKEGAVKKIKLSEDDPEAQKINMDLLSEAKAGGMSGKSTTA